MMTNFIYRETGEYLHMLNYSSGDVFSFKKDDGRLLIDNLRLASNKSEIDSEWHGFIAYAPAPIISRAFRGNLISLGMKFKIPTIVNLELNRKCSLCCKHCYISRKELLSNITSYFEIIDDVTIKKLFSALSEMGVFLVVFTGGECFLNRNLEIIYKQAITDKFIVEIFSNLQYLPRWFQKIDPAISGIGRIQTSVYSINPDIHDYITGKSGSLHKTLKNITFLKKKGFYIEVATPLLKLNYKCRLETEAYFTKDNIPHNFAWPILNEYYSKIKGKSNLNIGKEAFYNFCQEKPDFLLRKDFSKKNAPICPAATALFSIGSNGDVFPCSQYPKIIGNLLNSDLADVINSSEMKQISKYRISKIKEDSLPYNFCIGNNYSETGNEFIQPDFLKEILSYYHTRRKEVIEIAED